MINGIIEFVRKRKNISICELTLNICSEPMYYKFLQGTRNISEDKFIKIKQRLGFKLASVEKEKFYQHKIKYYLDKIISFNLKLENYPNVFPSLIAEDVTLLLSEDICVDYVLLILFYFKSKFDYQNCREYLNLILPFESNMSEEQRAFFYFHMIDVSKTKEQRDEFLSKQTELLNHLVDSSSYGFFYYELAQTYSRNYERQKSQKMCLKAENIFNEESNFNGKLKVNNLKVTYLMERDLFDEAIKLLKINLDNAKKINEKLEELKTISVLIYCYAINNNKSGIKFYYNYIINDFTSFMPYFPYSNSGFVILMALADSNLFFEENQFAKIMLEAYSLNEDQKYIFDYCQMLLVDSEATRINIIENKILLECTGHTSFNYIKALYKKLIRYYDENKIYKKASETKSKYIDLCSKYYVN